MRSIVGVQIAGGDVQVLGLPRRLSRAPQPCGLRHAGSLDLRRHHCARKPALLRSHLPRRRGRRSARNRLGRLEGYESSLAGRLSGGQRGRLSLATALLDHPEVLVLDEPTVGLDPVIREQLWAMFHALSAAGVTLLVSSHVMDEASRCARLVLMREGRIIAHDAPAAILARTGAANLGEAFLRLIAAEAPS